MTKDAESLSSPAAIVFELSRQECLDLLATHSVGRLAWNRPRAPPWVTPVNYRVYGEEIGFKLDLEREAEVPLQSEVSFEVDWIDREHRMGWSVLVQGMAHKSTHAENSAASWTPGGSQVLMRLAAARVNGRRLLPDELVWPIEGDGYL